MPTVQSKITPAGLLFEVQQYCYTPTSTVSQGVETALYSFIGKCTPWDDELNPDTPNLSAYNTKKVFGDMIAAKQITTKNICPVVPRRDWVANSVYEAFTDKSEFTYDADGIIEQNFYIKNSYDQIFKCIANNIVAESNVSTVEPAITPGTTDASVPITLSDGYKWVYITTIEKGLKQNFFDTNWLPITLTTDTPTTNSDAGWGMVDVVSLTNQGSGYDSNPAMTLVTITGDGTGAAGVVTLDSGKIKDVVITNRGSNYTQANVTIQSLTTSGSGATGEVVLSPINGNAFNPAAELGCNHVMVSLDINNKEAGSIIPDDIAFRQLGIIMNPEIYGGTLPNEPEYILTDLATVSTGLSNYSLNETVYQSASLQLETATFSATVCSIDSINNVLSLINIQGTPSVTSPLIGYTSGANRILTKYQTPQDVSGFIRGSGQIIYLENRETVQRTEDGNEQFRVVLKF